MKRLVAAILVCLCAQASAQIYSNSFQASSSSSKKIDAYLTSAVQAFKFNGVALVTKGGKVIFHKA